MSEMELESQIKALKETAKYLNERIDQLEQKLGEKKEGFALWEPEIGTPFYCINAESFVIEKVRSSDEAFTNCRLLANFNAYPNHEIAESEAKWLRAARKLRALARELNGDWKPDWFNSSEPKYFIHAANGYNYKVTKITCNPGSDVAYFSFEHDAQTALDNLTEDEREVLLG